MKSSIFYEGIYKAIQQETIDMLNKQANFLSERTLNSPRAVGDAIEAILKDEFKEIIAPYIEEYWSEFERKAMADIAFLDKNSLYYVVDVKTHRIGTKFNMPNLTSVRSLAKLSQDATKIFCILLVSYSVHENGIKVEDVQFFPIEFLEWKSLRIGALGWGQIQIKKAGDFNLAIQERDKWLDEFYERLFNFYKQQAEELEKRLLYFEKSYKQWSTKKNK
jgi:hypothetical protein